MFRGLVGCVLVAASFSMAFQANAESLREREDQSLRRSEGAASGIDPVVEVRRLRSSGGSSVAAGGESLVYSNTAADTFFPPGADRRIADDVLLTELCGCRLTRYELPVSGGGNGAGAGFEVEIGMYDSCPSTGGQLIPGTSATVSFPDDAQYLVSIDLQDDFVEIPSGVWLAVEFDRAGAGWFVGEPPSVGLSDDIYDFPGFECGAQIGSDFYASFAAEVFCAPPGPPQVTNPLPPNLAQGVTTNLTLAWNGGIPEALAAAGPQDFITPDEFESATVHPDIALDTLMDAIDNGEIEDPMTWTLPDVAPRQYFGPSSNGIAGFTVPTVTTDDLFEFEDTEDILATGYSTGQLYNLMSQATNSVLAEHGDNFDFVAFWLNFQPISQIGAAFYLGLFNDTQGIGLNQFNNRPNFGVAGNEVQGWVMMWNQANWETGYFTFTQLVLGQEFEHRWALYLDPIAGGRAVQGNNGSCGRSAHWNFRVDGQGSGMEIAEWVGSNPAIRQGGTLNFNSDIPDGVFSYPDLYLMGYVAGAEMDSLSSELRYMDNNNNCNGTYSGPISTWDSSDIIATNGTRIPSFVSSQKNFSTAWVVLHRPGSPPTNQQKNRMVNILNTWNDVWINSVVNRGTMSNVLNPVEPQLCSVSYDVALGTQNPPNSLICEATTDKTCDAGSLDAGATYFWQVTATNDSGTTDGPVWQFETLSPADDCNNNGVLDSQDIANGTSEDCNSNNEPDECEPDADGDGVPDGCDVCAGSDDGVDPDGDGVPSGCDPCPNDNPDDPDEDGVCTSDDNCALPNPLQIDCQPNGVGDVCDIDSGTSDDVDLDGIPDECGIQPPAAPLAEDSLALSCVDSSACPNESTCIDDVCYAPKNRYLSVRTNPANSGVISARRVSVMDNGSPVEVGWIDAPSSLTLLGEPNDVWVSNLSPNPVFVDWSSLAASVVHVGDCAMAPGYTYQIDAVRQGDEVGAGSFSAPLMLPTTQTWGDVVGTDSTSPADGTVNFVDIQATVSGFQGLQNVSKVFLELDGSGELNNIPDVANVNFADILRAVEAFQVRPYPFADPTACP
ncbi:MAG: hypothetical protein ACPGXK_12675 [Phycisphaerae bacterium]